MIRYGGNDFGSIKYYIMAGNKCQLKDFYHDNGRKWQIQH